MTQVKSVMGKQARMARAIAGTEYSMPKSGRRDLTSNEKRIARHMAHKGATVHDIALAINWTMNEVTLWQKLKAINIKTSRTLSNYYHHD